MVGDGEHASIYLDDTWGQSAGVHPVDRSWVGCSAAGYFLVCFSRQLIITHSPLCVAIEMPTKILS